MIFWIITVGVVCIITSVVFYKPYLGIAFVIVSIPFEGKISLDYFTFYPLEIILAIIIFVCLIKLIVRRVNYFRNTKLILLYLPFMLCILLSSLKSMELSLTIKEVVRWLELIVVYFLTINLINDDKKMRIVLYSIFLTMAVVSTSGIINYYNSAGNTPWGHRAFFFFGNPNPFAGYINLMIPVLFCMMMVSVSLWERVVLGTFAVISIMACFFSFSRSAWLSLILTVPLVFFMVKAKRKVTYLLVMFIMFATFFAVICSFSNVSKDFSGKSLTTRLNIEYRIMSYPMGFSMVKDNLAFGIGIGNYPLLIEKFVNIVTEPLYKRMMRIKEKTFGSDYLGVASDLDNLAELYCSQGRYTEAEPLYQRALRIREKSFGLGHPAVESDLSNLAEFYCSQGKYSEAEHLFKHALKVRERVLGLDHRCVATTLSNLAVIYYFLGRNLEAEKICKLALEIDENVLDPDHPYISGDSKNLTPLLRTKGRSFTKMTYLITTNLHSLYLQVFVEAGLIGLFAFVFWLVCIIKYLMSSLKTLENSRHYWLFVGLMGGVIVYLFNNLTEVLTVHGIHLQWGIILGLAVVLSQLKESEPCLKTS